MLQLFKKLSTCFSITQFLLTRRPPARDASPQRVVHLKLMKQCYGGNQISTKHAIRNSNGPDSRAPAPRPERLEPEKHFYRLEGSRSDRQGGRGGARRRTLPQGAWSFLRPRLHFQSRPRATYFAVDAHRAWHARYTDHSRSSPQRAPLWGPLRRE